MIKKGTAAIVLAAGNGKRMRSTTKKQYLLLGGRPLVYYALRAFEHSCVERIILVVSPGEESYCREKIVDAYGFQKVGAVVEGGEQRYHSVYCGLQQAAASEYVLIHDGARPFVTGEMIERALESAMQDGACVVGMPVKDTIKISDEAGYVKQTPDRTHVWAIQTPQAFRTQLIIDAYRTLLRQPDISVTDDAMVLEQVTGQKARLIEGSYHNIKITTPEDLQVAEVFLHSSAEHVG